MASCFNHRAFVLTYKCQSVTVSDKNSRDMSTGCCSFPAAPSPLPPNDVNQSQFTESCTQTLGGRGESKVSQQV